MQPFPEVNLERPITSFRLTSQSISDWPHRIKFVASAIGGGWAMRRVIRSLAGLHLLPGRRAGSLGTIGPPHRSARPRPRGVGHPRSGACEPPPCRNRAMGGRTVPPRDVCAARVRRSRLHGRTSRERTRGEGKRSGDLGPEPFPRRHRSPDDTREVVGVAALQLCRDVRRGTRARSTCGEAYRARSRACRISSTRPSRRDRMRSCIRA